MDEFMVREVWRRAENSCEYCRIPQIFYPAPFEMDHIIARQHGGTTVLGNLALSCLHCNSHKGPNIAGIDPVTKRLTRLFHPRRHRWERHFRWQGAVLTGASPIGRVSIQVLSMNDPFLRGLRELLIEEGLFPS